MGFWVGPPPSADVRHAELLLKLAEEPTFHLTLCKILRGSGLDHAGGGWGQDGPHGQAGRGGTQLHPFGDSGIGVLAEPAS